MKKLILILFICGGMYYFYKRNIDVPMSVSEAVESRDHNVRVKGEVVSNLKLLYGVYTLKDQKSDQTIMVLTDNELPKTGTIVSKTLTRHDIVTVNDKKVSLYKEVVP